MTRILIISDIHANYTALEAVLENAGSVDAVWSLGDLVGYGPDPNECIERIRSLPNLACVLGNHDAAVLRRIDTGTFNREAGISANWTQRHLNPSGMAYLESLPEKLTFDENVTIAHGSPRNPVWEYLLDVFSAAINFKYFNTQMCIVGHTHLPLAFILDGDGVVHIKQLEDDEEIKIDARIILNPGSVGQPRDHDARAAYAIFYPEEKRWECHRVNYMIADVQQRILDAGLPIHHAERLGQGW
jgi:predicted phosphodiesterase